MFDLEACSKCIFADTDSLHISLSCMVYTFDTVDVVMELTLDNRFKVRLHVFTCNFNNICNMVFYFTCITCMYKLCTVYTGTIEFNLHVFTTDNLTFECRCESNRDIDVCNFDLDVTCFQRSCIPFGDVFLADQALRYSCNIFLVCDNRESKSDSACTTSYDHII